MRIFVPDYSAAVLYAVALVIVVACVVFAIVPID